MMRKFCILISFFLLSNVPYPLYAQTYAKKLYNEYRDIYLPPKDVPIDSKTKNIIQLGQKIFSDIRLSRNGKMACQTCHQPQMGFSDQNARAIGNSGLPLKRKSMTLYHIQEDDIFFWDGRVTTLQDQFIAALENPDEMDFSISEALTIMQQDPAYQELFKKTALSPSKETIIQAVTTFVKSITPPHTRFDKWLEGDLTALTKKELKGFELFNTKANCTACHIGYRFKDGLLNDIGLSDHDLGLGAITKKADDAHMFKTPSLRGVKDHAPYMHDGSLKTLREVIEHYNAPEFKRGDTDIPPPKDQGNVIAFHNFTQPLNLTPQEIDALIAFLKTL